MQTKTRDIFETISILRGKVEARIHARSAVERCTRDQQVTILKPMREAYGDDRGLRISVLALIFPIGLVDAGVMNNGMLFFEWGEVKSTTHLTKLQASVLIEFFYGRDTEIAEGTQLTDEAALFLLECGRHFERLPA